jgi:DNA-binding LytR/AlgR family response regulator
LIYNESVNIKNLNIILTNAGFNTYLAEDVSNGIEIARIYTPNLIICDLIENGRPVTEVIKELSEHERTKIIPLLFLSSNPDFNEMRRIMNSGADDYIPFPINENELIESINIRLKKYASIKEKYDSLSKETIEASGQLPIIEDHILVKIGTNLRIIKFDEILCVSASKEYTEIITKDSKKYIIRKSLKKWIDILPSISFLQIHRSTIININFIDSMKKLSESSYEIALVNCKTPFHVSIRNAKKIKRWFYT